MASGIVDAANLVYRFQISLGIRGSVLQMNFHCRDALIPNTTPETAHEEFRGWVLGTFRNSLSNELQITRLATTRLNDNEFFQQDFTNTAGLFGQPTRSSMLALSVAMKSNSRSRRANGRVFWPMAGSPSTDRAEDATQQIITTAINDCMDKFAGIILLGQMKLVVVGMNKDQIKGGPKLPKQWNDVVAMRLNPIATSLRSRRAGKGS